MATSTINITPEVKSAVVYDESKDFGTSGDVTSCYFYLPADFHQSLGAKIEEFWPAATWTPKASFGYCIVKDYTFDNRTGRVDIHSSLGQQYHIKIRLIYI